MGRVQNYKSWSPEMVPDPAYCCYGLEYFCFEGDGLWTSPDAQLIALAKKEIQQIGLAERRRRRRRLRHPPAESLSRLRRQLPAARGHRSRARSRSSYPNAASGRPQRHAQIQQSGPRHDDRHADRKKYSRAQSPVRCVGRELRTRNITKPERPAPRKRPPRRASPGGSTITCRPF